MSEGITHLVEGAGIFLNLCSVVVVVDGLIVVLGSYLIGFRQLSPEENFSRFKPRLAKVLMVALFAP